MPSTKYQPFFSDTYSTWKQVEDEDEAVLLSRDREPRVIRLDFDLDYGITYFEVVPSGFRLECRTNQNPPNCFVGYSLDKKMRYEMHMHPQTNGVVCIIFKDNQTSVVTKYEVSGYKVENGFYMLNKNRIGMSKYPN